MQLAAPVVGSVGCILQHCALLGLESAGFSDRSQFSGASADQARESMDENGGPGAPQFLGSLSPCPEQAKAWLKGSESKNSNCMARKLQLMAWLS